MCVPSFWSASRISRRLGGGGGGDLTLNFPPDLLRRDVLLEFIIGIIRDLTIKAVVPRYLLVYMQRATEDPVIRGWSRFLDGNLNETCHAIGGLVGRAGVLRFQNKVASV